MLTNEQNNTRIEDYGNLDARENRRHTREAVPFEVNVYGFLATACFLKIGNLINQYITCWIKKNKPSKSLARLDYVQNLGRYG